MHAKKLKKNKKKNVIKNKTSASCIMFPKTGTSLPGSHLLNPNTKVVLRLIKVPAEALRQLLCTEEEHTRDNITEEVT